MKRKATKDERSGYELALSIIEKAAKDERSGYELVLSIIESALDKALERAEREPDSAAAREKVAEWQRLRANLLRAEPRLASDCSDPWSGLEAPRRSAMH